MIKIREEYDLKEYVSSKFNSSLTEWYNQLINKTIDELEVEDVCKMIRQNIIIELATQKAIELFFDDPYDGFIYDGELLNALTLINFKQISEPKIKVEKLKIRVKELIEFFKDADWLIEHSIDEFDFVNEESDCKFDWFDKESKIEYFQNLNKLLENLE